MRSCRLPSLLSLFCALLLLAAPAAAQTPTTFDDPELVGEYQELIQAEDLAARLYYFSSDHFEGREALTRGQKMAAEYLASQYRQLNLEPRGTAEANDPRAPEHYYQNFTLHGYRLTSARLDALQGEEAVASTTYALDGPDGASFLIEGNMEESEGGVVFAGYGIGGDEVDYNDYEALEEADLSINGQWLVLLRDEPMDEEGQSLITDDGAPSDWTAEWGRKLQHAFSRGLPAGAIVVADTGPEGIDVEERAEILAEFQPPGQMSLSEFDLPQTIPPVYFVSSDFADEVLAPSGETVESLREEINTTLEPVVFDVPEVTLSSTLEHESYTEESENIAAFIEGSDPELQDEVIVITSHYDHVGLNPARQDYINNGADDDGSGTIGTLALAEAFQQAAEEGNGPRRSLLFLNVSAEEKGLLGSEYYSQTEPLFPIENTVLNVNFDMIGRIDPSYEGPDDDYVYIIGGELISEDLHEILEEANDVTGIDFTLSDRYNTLDDPLQLYRRSDHWNFARHDIPFAFFFTGLHEDYHDVGDEAHKIEYERMQEIVRLAFATVWQVANQDEHPEVRENWQEEPPASSD